MEVGKAGRGAHAAVYLCLPEQEVALAEDPEQLRKTLVAVQFDRSIGRKGLADELEILRYVNGQASRHYLQQLFAEVLDWEIGYQPSWMVMSTWSVCCDLAALQGKFLSLPEEFLWLFYTQLHRALDFLHFACHPAVVHQDLHKGNVLVGYSDSNRLDLPQLKIIDFGLAEQYVPNKGSAWTTALYQERDTYDVFTILDHVIHEAESTLSRWNYAFRTSRIQTGLPKNRSDEFYSFHVALNKALQIEKPVKSEVRESLWHDYGAYATQRLDSTSESSMSTIPDIILDVIKSRVEANENKIKQLLCDSA